MPEMQQHQRGSLISSATAAHRRMSSEEVDPHQSVPIPPWVYPNDSSNAAALLAASSQQRREPHPPPPTHYKAGRKWDALRSDSPPLLSAPIAEHQERWRPFMYSGPNPMEQERRARVVNQRWIDENMPHLSEGWKESDDVDITAPANGNYKGFSALMYRGKWLVSPERQERSIRFMWRLLLKNPFVPLVFRIIIMAFMCAALGIAANIRERVNQVNNDANLSNQCAPRASTYMAIVIGSVAIPYVSYVTWDEYMSKPLGLRSVAAKVLLLLCDLYFIVFSASNLSLAMDALYDHRWACYDDTYAIIGSDGSSGGDVIYNVPATCPNNPYICHRQKALSAVLLIGLVAWLVTFSLSVLRVVEKLRPD